MRACALHWMKQHNASEPLLSIPEEEVNKGDDAVNTYIRLLELSKREELIRRRKVCVVGPSGGGKTSLVKSLCSRQSVLVDVHDRTIGIDLLCCSFKSKAKVGSLDSSRYDVMFWDFAGQDIYQVAHSLFFSKRTLFMMCVDLEKYSRLFDNEPTQSNELSRWLYKSVFHRARHILARQTDAELVLVGCKIDAVPSAKLSQLEEDLRSRLKTWILNFTKELEGSTQAAIKKSVDEFQERHQLHVSVKTVQAVEKSTAKVQEAVTFAPERAFVMPALYTAVLREIEKMREVDQAKANEGFFDLVKNLFTSSRVTMINRVKSLIVSSEWLVEYLTATIPELSPRDCSNILRTLHDLGDILWYEHRFGDQAASDTIVLDPTIVLDAVREVVNHNHEHSSGSDYQVLRESGLMRHSLLETFTMWGALSRESRSLVLFFKGLLQYFNLAYPKDGPMRWDSDLMVPAYWRASAASTDANGDSVLLIAPSVDPSFTQQACWRYSIPLDVSDEIFDKFVVHSYDPKIRRHVGADIVTISVDQEFAVCVRRLPATDKPNAVTLMDWILIEISSSSMEVCWEQMKPFVIAMESLLMQYPGLPKLDRHIIHKASKPMKTAKGETPKDDIIDVARFLTKRKAARVGHELFDAIAEHFIQRSSGLKKGSRPAHSA